MKGSKISRRDVVIGSGALVAGAAFSTRVLSAAPPASPVTPALIEAAKKEGKVIWYTSIDLKLSEQIGKAFEAKYPGVACTVERSGAERCYSASARNTPPMYMLSTWSIRRTLRCWSYWKNQGMLAPYVPEDVAKFYPAEHKDVDGTYRQLPRLPLHHRLQHQSGEKGRSAEELRRSARSDNGRARSSRRIPATAAPS